MTITFEKTMTVKFKPANLHHSLETSAQEHVSKQSKSLKVAPICLMLHLYHNIIFAIFSIYTIGYLSHIHAILSHSLMECSSYRTTQLVQYSQLKCPADPQMIHDNYKISFLLSSYILQ